MCARCATDLALLNKQPGGWRSWLSPNVRTRSRRGRRSPRWRSDSRRDRRASVRSNRDDSISGARRRRDAVRRDRRAARRCLRVGPARRRSALDRGLRARVRRPPRRRGRHRRRRDDRVHARRSAGGDGGRRHPPVRDRVPISRRPAHRLGRAGLRGLRGIRRDALTRAGTCSTPCASTACCRRSACGSRLVSIIRSRGSPR